jgi:hypothetical protein
MKDFSLPFLVSKKLLDGYYEAMIKQDGQRAYGIAADLVEMALKLQDIAGEDKKV